MSLLPFDPVIARLRVRSPRRDDARLRLEVARDLAVDVLRPRHLAPSAILLVRRVEIAAEHTRRQAVIHHRMQDARDHARRPMDGIIDAASDALLFTDDAELMTCLALQLSTVRGALPWWCHAVGRYFATGSLFALLSSRIELLPAVLAQLKAWNAAAAAISQLTPAACARLREAITRECGLYHLQHVWRSTPALTRAQAIEWPGDTAADECRRPPPFNRGPAALAPTPALNPVDLPVSRSPFEPWLGNVGATAGLQQHLLLGVALGAAKAPNILGSREFSRRLGHWLARIGMRAPDPPAAMGPHGSGPPAASSASIAGEGALASHGLDARAVLPAHVHPEDHATAPRAPDKHESTAIEPALDDSPMEGVATGLGGVFLLINVMEHLGLPECFEEQCGLASSVGSFGTLEAIARALAGMLGEALRHDPVWSVLASLDGREAHQPPRAQGLRPPGHRLPPAWSEVVCASGYPALEALQREGWPTALLDWLRLAIPYISARIALACGLPDAAEAVRTLLEVQARVHVTEAHIDVVAPLENIRVPIRLAGLDRSPGWVPSLQRIVLIHFE